MHHLFDNEFIYNTFNKFKRPSNLEIIPLKAVCSKCEGYGWYDWVARLTADEEKEFTRSDLTHPIIVKNENPISVIYVSTWSDVKTIYYPSNFTPSQLTYRCEKCFGSGIPISSDHNIHPITIDDLEKVPFKEPPPLKSIQQSFLKGLQTYIKGVYNNVTSKRISQRF
jgi:hypothetical protein